MNGAPSAPSFTFDEFRRFTEAMREVQRRGASTMAECLRDAGIAVAMPSPERREAGLWHGPLVEHWKHFDRMRRIAWQAEHPSFDHDARAAAKALGISRVAAEFESRPEPFPSPDDPVLLAYWWRAVLAPDRQRQRTT